MKPFALLALLALGLAAPASAELTAAERRMSETVEQESERSVAWVAWVA